MFTASVIVPCYNEEMTIALLLDAIYHQTFSHQHLEVVIADGLSKDQTRDRIAQYQEEHPDLSIQVIDNPQRIIPAALNRAIQHATGEYILRLDGHCMPHRDYVELCLRALQEGRGNNVGGVWEIFPSTRTGEAPTAIARGIAAAAAHPLGIGDAKYRYSKQAQSVETVPFGAYRRDYIVELGGYEETLLTNEDYELNARMRKRGGVIWLDPAIRSVYFSRPTLTSLMEQYWRYGFWKARMLRLHPRTLRWRQALPPIFVLSLITFAVLSIWSRIALILLMVEIGLYFLILLGVGAQMALKKKDWGVLFTMPLAIIVMHLTWGSAFIFSMMSSILKKD